MQLQHNRCHTRYKEKQQIAMETIANFLRNSELSFSKPATSAC